MKHFFFTCVLGLSIQICASPNNQSLDNNPFVVYATETMQIIVPEYPLNTGSFQVEPIFNKGNYGYWDEQNQKEAYSLMQSIAQVWLKKGISDYLVYGREDTHHSSQVFRWEIVPYPSSKTTKDRLLQQIKTLWNTTYGAFGLSETDRQKLANELRYELETLSYNPEKLIESSNDKDNDLFCNEAIITSQRVYEGQDINILYDYAPLSELHFLLVTKKHHQKFGELSIEEYLEATALTQKMMQFYQNKGYRIVNIFTKTGKEAGQAQPHWHQHIVFMRSRTEELAGLLTVLKNLFFGHSPLKKEALINRVQSIKEEFTENDLFE